MGKSHEKLEQNDKKRSDKLLKSDQKLEKERTKRKQIEEAYRESENLLHTVLESLPIGICIIQENTIIYQNPSLQKIFGPVPKRFTTDVSSFLDYVHPEDAESFKEAFRQIKSGRKQKTEVDFRFYPPRQNSHEPDLAYASCTAFSISYQGKKSVMLNLVDRTRAQKTEQLLTIREKMSSLGHVAAGIAHEIRNPLTGINTYLYTLEDLCEEEIIEGDRIKLLKQIVSQFQLASDKIETVIKRVLDFSRPNPPAMNLVDLNQCIEKALNLSAAMLRKDGIKLEKSLEPDLPQCYADSHLIEQVVLNLINNATRAMKKSSTAKNILIESCCRKKNLYINVSDSGPGIPQKLKEQIFDPFFTTNADGTGIGLSIVQRIVSDHHGNIGILKSKFGGATFSVELPVEKRTRAR